MRNKVTRPQQVMYTHDNILRLIKNTMKSNGISQAEVADKIHMNHGLFNRKINGHIEFKLDEILEIIWFLNLYIDIRLR